MENESSENKTKVNGEAVIILTRQGARHLAKRLKRSRVAFEDAYLDMISDIQAKGSAFGLSLCKEYGVYRPESISKNMAANFLALREKISQKISPLSDEPLPPDFLISRSALFYYPDWIVLGNLMANDRGLIDKFPNFPGWKHEEHLAFVFVWCGSGDDGEGLYKFAYEVRRKRHIQVGDLGDID